MVAHHIMVGHFQLATHQEEKWCSTITLKFSDTLREELKMDLTNKTVDIKTHSSDFVSKKTSVEVAVFSQVVTGVLRKDGDYWLDIDGVFQDISDSELMIAVSERLTALPD